MVAELIYDGFQRAVVSDQTLIDDDGSIAERFNIFHVMAGEQHGDLPLALIVLEKLLHLTLRNDIEPDGRLVKQQQVGAVQ